MTGSWRCRRPFQKVRETAQAADEAFSAILLKVTKDEEVTTFKKRAEEVSTAAGEAVVLCLRSLGVAETKLQCSVTCSSGSGGGSSCAGVGPPGGSDEAEHSDARCFPH